MEMKLFWKLILAVSTAVTLAACSSTPENTPVEDRTTSATGTTPNPGTSTSGAGPSSGANASTLPGGPNAGNPLKDPRSPLSRREIFYDYDSFVVRDEYKPLLEAHAAYLKNNRNARIKVEGNTDERGSREYNLGLGERRGNAVSSALQANGGQAAQLNVVSYGEERPTCSDSNDDCWGKNRRVEIVYTAK